VLYAQYADADTTTTHKQIVAALAVTRTRAEAFAAAAKDLASTHVTEPAAAQLARAWNHELLRAREAESTALSRKTEYYTPAKTVEDGAGGERSAVKKAARAERAAALAAKAAAEHTAAVAAAAAAAAAAVDGSDDVASDSESIGAESASSDAPSMRLTAAQRSAVRAAKLASKRHASTGAADAAATHAAAAASDLVARQATAAAEAAAGVAEKVAAATAAAAALQARLLPPLPVARRSIYMHIEGVTGLPKALLAAGAVTLRLSWCGRGMGSTVNSATVSENGAAQWPTAQSFLLSLPTEPISTTGTSSNSSTASSVGGVMIQQQRPQLKIEVWQGRYCHGTLDLEGDDLLRQCQRITNTVHKASTTTNSSSGSDACSSIAKRPHYYPHSVPPATAAIPAVSHAITAIAGSVASGGRLLLRAYVLESGTGEALQAAQEVATAAASRWHGAVNSNRSNSSTDFSSVREQKVIALATAMTRRWQCPLLYRLQALELVLSDACTATVGQRSVIIVVKRVCRTAVSNTSAAKAAHINSSTAQQAIEQQQLVTRNTEFTAAPDTGESAGAASTALVVHNSNDVLAIENQSSEELSILPATAADTAPAATAAVTSAAVATETVTTSTVTEEVGRSQPLKLVPLLSCYTQSFALPAAALLEQLIDGCSEDNAATAGGAVIEVHVCVPKRFAAFTAAVAASTKPTTSASADLRSSDNSSSSDSYSSTELLASVQLSAQQLRDCLGQAATVTLTPAAVTKVAVAKAAVTAASDTPTAAIASTITLVGHVVCAPPPRPRLLLQLSHFCEHARVADAATSDTSVGTGARCTRLTVSWCGAKQSNLLHNSTTNKRYVMKSVAAL
jgi:hypothetical protein